MLKALNCSDVDKVCFNLLVSQSKWLVNDITIRFEHVLFSTAKGRTDGIKLSGSQIGKQAASKSKGLFSAEDWMCSK